MSSISLSPATPTVERGKTVQMQATAKLSDGTTQDVTSKGSWDISDSNIATVSNEAGSVGLVTGKAVGSAQVLFAYADPKNSNKQVSAQADLQVGAPPAGSVIALPVGPQTTSESGGKAYFTVALGSAPTADVTIAVSSSNTAEGTVSPASLTFTSANWNAPQTVTVTGVDDSAADGPKQFIAVLSAAVSDDDVFSGVDPDDLTFTNLDNDSAGITVAPTSGLTTTEAGGTATFTVVLNSKPTADVVIALSSSATTEGAVSPASLTFTPANWNAPQTVTVTGVDDSAADGPQQYLVVTAPAVSSDPGYSGKDAANVSVSNTDNDSAGITVNPISGLTTTEAGGHATFTVVLNSKPSASVAIGLTSSDTTEGTVSPAALTFTTANWNAPQTVTVTGLDDDLQDGPQPYTIVTAAAVSDDPNYSGKDATDVAVSNTDNDTAGITVTPTADLVTTEAGGHATFTVVLNAQPTANVVIGLTSSDTSEGAVSPASVTFTADNWNAPQTVTLTGLNDDEQDGNQPYTIVTAPAMSSDAHYSGVDAGDVSVTNTDDDTAGITVTPSAEVLTTTEGGGQTTFTVVLNSQPTADITIGLTSSDTTEGTVSPASLTFTSDNWNAPQTVTVTGVNDDEQDGNQPYTIVIASAVSEDSRYSGFDAGNVDVSNTDNDTAGFTVTPTTGLNTTESGGQATFTVVLNSRPTADVAIGLTSSKTTEGTVSPASLTFTVENWSAPQTVTVTGIDDLVQDGAQIYSIVTAAAVSEDANYSGKDVPDVSLSNTDNDTAGITVAPISGLSTTEAGGQATFTVVLHSRPTADVTIGVTSSDTTEGTVSPASLTFTADNWNAPQTVTVTGVDDEVQDGAQPYTIVTAAAVSVDANYSGVDAADVSVSNTDNDTAGVTVNPTSGLVTTEGGGTATFTVVLHSRPTANVTIGVTSSDTTEGTVSPASLTFTADNWNAPQTVTVTGVNDSEQDGPQPYTIVTAAAVSDDNHYSGMNAADVSVSNTDNDTAGITVNPTSGLVTTEAGGTATFTVVLNTQPTADVTIGLTSSDTTEGTVSPASLTFTTDNWNAPQTVTVTGVDDDVQDGNQTYSVVLAAATSVDANFNGMDASDVSVTNNDNDAAGITVSAISGSTTEAGGTATFTVVLNTQPTANVVIGVSSNDTTEGTVSPASLTFTPANWNAAQTVTVTGVNDDVMDGNQPYTIIIAPAVAEGTHYSGLDAPDVSVTNTDDDNAGITVSPTSGLVTTEAGGTATFTVALISRPTANVVVGLSSSDTTEGTVSPASLTFTSANWSAPQTVTITGQPDSVVDGNQTYTIVTAAAVSDDPNYSGMTAADVQVTNNDGDTAGVTVNPSSITVGENGAEATFTLVLTSQPAANVTIGLASNDLTEGTVSPASVTFTALNWNAPQIVTVTGVDDLVEDGAQSFSIVTAPAVSDDPDYADLNAADVAATNVDNDTAGITVNPMAGLTTTENGGVALFTVVLNSQPTASVTIGLTSNDTSEGTVSPASLTFTALNWNAPQVVTVTGVNDSEQDGPQSYAIVTAPAVSGDANYNTMDAANVSVVNRDNDSPGITVYPSSGLTTTEQGAGTATFQIVLDGPPTADVAIGLTSSDTTEGTVSPASVTFTTVNWNAPQTVTVTGVDDLVADGNQPYQIITGAASSTDPGYDGLSSFDVSVTNTDNDSAGITVNPISGLTTTEAGGTDTFTVVLNSQPTADVTIAVSSSDTTEGTVSPVSLTFTPANWNAPQTVTATGVNDDVQDGNQTYTILLDPAVSSDTSGYDGMDPANVHVTNTDNDTAGITIDEGEGVATTEAGGTGTFTIVLNSEPTNDVIISLSSNDTTEGTVSPIEVVFTPDNWNAPQTVTVTGVDDDVQDGDQPYTIVTAAAVSTDNNYNDMDAANVSVTNIDNDSAGITVSAISGNTTEAGGTATFTVVLHSEPTADVTIALSSSDTTEGTVSPASLTFTALNWNAPQTVTVTGVNDDVQDGDQPYTIVTAPAVSADNNYNTRDAANVNVTNVDNDTAGITVSAISGDTTEAGGTATFTIVLNSEPTADVTIALSSSDTTEGTISPASLTFTPVNWNAPQEVIVTGVNDDVQDGSQPFTIVTAAAVSTDINYSGRDAANVAVTNVDNDTAGITVGAISGDTTEAGGTATFTVVLNSEPTANVTIALSSSDTTEGTVSPASLTFTPVNWNAPQEVTVTGVNDDVQDGNQPFTIVTAAAVSTDTNYSGRDAANVAVTNIDDDTAGITVSAISGHTTEAGGTATFTVVLHSEPVADVTIAVSSSDTTEGTVSPASLTFTAENWNAPQTVTVTGVDDAVQDGDQPFTIITAPALSSSPLYDGMDAGDVAVTNNDNDTAGITVSAISAHTTEAGGTATFTVVLASQPTANVAIGLSSSDTTEGTVSPDSLTFTADNWNAPQTVTVTGVNDDVQDGNQPFTILTAPAVSADSNYNTRNANDVAVTNDDDDTAGFVITPSSGLATSEPDGSALFSVRLQSQPTADVTLPLSSSDVTEGTVSPDSLTFTPSNWNTPQIVTVTGVNDVLRDGNQPYQIVTGAATSDDPNYSGMDPTNVTLTNTDDDSPGFIISPTSGLVTTEAGGTATFTIVLLAPPTADVTFTLTSSDLTEGTALPAQVTFTAANWSTPQTITVMGIDDFVADGDQPYTIITNPAESADLGYAGLNPADVSCTNQDND